MNTSMPKWLKTTIVVVACFFTLLIVKPWFSVKMGHVGVTFNRLSGKTASYNMGTHFRIPFIHRVDIYDVRQQKASYKAEGASIDQQTVILNLELIYKLQANKVDVVAKDIGRGYVTKVIDPQFIQQAKNAVAQYQVEDVIKQRDELKDIIANNIRTILSNDNIIVLSVNLVNIDFDEEYANAIKQKMVAAEGIKTAVNMRKQEEENVKSRVIKAKAEAEEKRLLSLNTSEKAIALEWIKKWDGESPTMMMAGKGEGGSVLIDMRGQSK